eukprot:6469827-Amphidinium_carterae.1
MPLLSRLQLQRAPNIGSIPLGHLVETVAWVTCATRIQALRDLWVDETVPTLPPSGQPWQWQALCSGCLWFTWLVFCLLISAPGAIDSMLHAIPGFLATSKGFLWCMTQAATLTSAVLTGVALPECAKRLASRKWKFLVSEVELCAAGKLL